ncbi:MAG: SDR family oxidoreductase [Acidobacteriaceae bacterium]|nr:SDR family oxidoreductase [Acidobacteriaceae bacterium]MBV9224254.1 SDR family oxidoreductase [Acidobacteriaceae bacterium]
MQDFTGKVAIVTGTTGIGKAIAKRLAQGGAHVLSCGIDSKANEELAGESKGEGLTIEVRQTDVSRPEQVQAAVDEAVKLFDGLDIIVNSAAVHPFGNALETAIEVWDRCWKVNVSSIFLFAHFGIPEIKKRGGGAIINLASVQGHACQAGVTAYVASKGAILSLTRALAVDHAHDKIRVNSISPGSIDTPMLATAAKLFSPDLPVEQVIERFGSAHPLGRVGQVEEVAELAAFLASDKAGFCTGGDYLIDGGLKAGIGVK